MFPGTWEPLTHGRLCVTGPELKIATCIRAGFLFLFFFSLYKNVHTDARHSCRDMDRHNIHALIETQEWSVIPTVTSLAALSRSREPSQTPPSQTSIRGNCEHDQSFFSKRFCIRVPAPIDYLPQVLNLLCFIICFAYDCLILVACDRVPQNVLIGAGICKTINPKRRCSRQ